MFTVFFRMSECSHKSLAACFLFFTVYLIFIEGFQTPETQFSVHCDTFFFLWVCATRWTIFVMHLNNSLRTMPINGLNEDIENPWWAHLMPESTKKGRLLAEYVRTLAAFTGSRLWDGDQSVGDLLGNVSVGFPGGASGKEPSCQGRRPQKHRFDPGLGRYPGEGHGNPFLYSCLENPMGRGAWLAIVHRVAKNQTWMKWLSKHACICDQYQGREEMEAGVS